MNLTYSPEDRAFREKTRRWLDVNVPKDDAKTLDERKAWHRRLYEAGYVGMLWPKAYGGWEATPMQQAIAPARAISRSEEHTSELQSRQYLVCRLLLEKKNNKIKACAGTRQQ